MDVSTALENNVCEYYQNIGTVCPQIQKGQFITAAADRPQSEFSYLNQFISWYKLIVPEQIKHQPPTNGDEDEISFSYSITPVNGRKVMDLPLSYREIRPARLSSSDVNVPLITTGNMASPCVTLKEQLAKEYRWLSHVEGTLKMKFLLNQTVSWAAYHASLTEEQVVPSINAMLPLFAEEASSPSMLGHCFEVI